MESGIARTVWFVLILGAMVLGDDRLSPKLLYDQHRWFELRDAIQGQMTYHLRRLRLHGIIERIPQTHRYRITSSGLRTLWFCTRTYSRILRPGLASVLPALSPANTALRRSFDKLDQEVTAWIQHQKLVA